MLTTRDILGVEILSVGTWQGTGCPPKGCEFTTDDLDEFVATYEATKDSIHPPMKLGHDDGQKLLQADGYPAAGWLSNIRREGEKLFADLLKVPGKIADLMDAGAYRKRSVELNQFTNGDKKLLGISGMALLGADLPAVENLSDIMSWYSAQFAAAPDEAGRIVVFSAPEPDLGQRLTTYVDNAEHVLADVQAFGKRTGELVALRAKDGRTISEGHLERLASLRDGLREAESAIAGFLTETPDPPKEQDYTRVMRARLRIAELRGAELIGA